MNCDLSGLTVAGRVADINLHYLLGSVARYCVCQIRKRKVTLLLVRLNFLKELARLSVCLLAHFVKWYVFVIQYLRDVIFSFVRGRVLFVLRSSTQFAK